MELLGCNRASATSDRDLRTDLDGPVRGYLEMVAHVAGLAGKPDEQLVLVRKEGFNARTHRYLGSGYGIVGLADVEHAQGVVVERVEVIPPTTKRAMEPPVPFAPGETKAELPSFVQPWKSPAMATTKAFTRIFFRMIGIRKIIGG